VKRKCAARWPTVFSMPAPDELSVFIERLDSGYKADIYLAGSDPLHAWALPLRRRLSWADNLEMAVAPPEHVVLRKLAYFREGRSAKHPADIHAIVEVTGVYESAMQPWLVALGLEEFWREMKSAW